MDTLRMFYEERIFSEGLPKFEELTEAELNRLQKSSSFVFYDLHLKLRELVSAILKKFSLKLK